MTWFTGFHTGSGCGGYSDGSMEMRIGFHFFMEDFPLLEERHNRWIENRRLSMLNRDMRNDFEIDRSSFVHNHPTMIKAISRVTRAEADRNEIRLELREQFEKNTIIRYNELPSDYDQLCNDFFADGRYM